MEQARGIIVKTLTILAGFWIADLAAARVQAGLAAGESIERIMDGMTTMLQHPLALGFDRTSLLCGLGGACAVGLFHLYRWSMKRNWRDGEEYGSARWSVFCQVGVGRFGVSFSPCERRVSGRFGVGRSCWLLVIALVIA